MPKKSEKAVKCSVSKRRVWCYMTNDKCTKYHTTNASKIESVLLPAFQLQGFYYYENINKMDLNHLK